MGLFAFLALGITATVVWTLLFGDGIEEPAEDGAYLGAERGKPLLPGHSFQAIDKDHRRRRSALGFLQQVQEAFRFEDEIERHLVYPGFRCLGGHLHQFRLPASDRAFDYHSGDLRQPPC